MSKKMWALGASLVALAAGGGLWLAGNKGAEAASKTPAKAAALVFSPREVATVQARALPLSVEFSGPLVAPDTAVVKAKAAGTLITLSVAEGSRVRKGETLGLLDLSDLNARLQERQALVESARATLVQAERTHASNQNLADQQFISPIALETSRAALGTARAQLGAAQAQAETIRIALRDAALVAPIDGIVAKRQAVPGEKVAAEQPILSVVSLRSLEMAGSVGTRDIGQLKAGMPVKVQVEGDSQAIEGRLARIAPAIDAGTRSIGVAVAIANPDERLRAGQFAMARVALPAGAEVLAVPATALGSASGQEFVWTLEQGKLLRRTVTTGRRDAASGLVEVLQGLAPATVVLASPFENLKEGAEARVGDPTASAPAAAAASAASR